MKKMLAVTFCLCFWSLFGVFGVETDVSVSVMEGDSFTLKNDDTQILRDDLIMWKFGQILIAQINRNNKIKLFENVSDGRFRGRIQLDQTGSLIIINIRTTDSGQYKLITTSNETPLKIFTLTVYARLPVPVITSDSSLNSSSSESSSKCVLVCSVVDVTPVTLSWYKGNSLLSSISVSDLNRSLSLHLECVDDSYSCVVNNPIRNQTKHLDITEVCQPCSGVFGVETDVSVSVMEGDSVTLKNDDTQILRDEGIMWRFGQILIAEFNRDDNKIKLFDDDAADGRYRGRIQLDQTGSLIITNIRITDSGQYKLITTSTNETPLKIFTLTVYARLPVPVIIRDSSLYSSSSKCVLVCSVVNVTQVTLSWYKGHSLLSSISVSDLNRSLSLHLECVDDSYSCVINNPIRNQTKHLNITEVYQLCSGVSGLFVTVGVLLPLAAAVTAGVIY